MEERIIGIDLGTTNSLSATVFEDGPEVIGIAGENPITPSVLHHTGQAWIVGEEALPYRLSSPKNTLFSVKRLMGCDLSELTEDIKRLPYTIVAAQRKLVKVSVQGREYTPQEISAEILKKVKQRAEQSLGVPVKKVVITVPAYFDDVQRQATRDAARIAGLEVARIINEPTAAAIAYGLDEKKDGYVAVFDLGGGTFDISILKLSKKVFKVVSTHGNTHLGGDDFDNVIAEELKARILRDAPEIRFDDAYSQQLLKQTAEDIKKRISFTQETAYQLELSGRSFSGILTAAQFNQRIHPLVEQTLHSCQHALKEAKLGIDEIGEVVLVGGSTVIPYVRQQVARFFQKQPHAAIDPYKVVAIGAGIQGHLLAGGRRDFILLDVIPLSLGIETLGGTFSKLITQNTTIPTEASELFTTQVDNQTAIDINIYQGERELVKDCRCLGQFKLRSIPPMPAGLPLVEVTFKVDANGILKVSALEKRSQQQTEIEIIPFHGLTRAEIDRIIEESFEYAIDDFNVRQLIEFRQAAERVFKGIEDHWKMAQELLSAKQQTAIQKQVEIVRHAAQGEDPQALKRQMDILGELTRPLADTVIGKAVLSELKKTETGLSVP
ncbi:Fe-S protein assembly chaperone HscA [Deltaproteobacteria bacterium TL4]